MKYLIFFISTIIFSTKTALANVQTLTGIPGDWVGLVDWIIPNVLTIGTALAVLMLVIGGVQILLYGGSQGAQSAAKERIMNAFYGLLILWLSYAALKLIYSDLVVFDFNLNL